MKTEFHLSANPRINTKDALKNHMPMNFFSLICYVIEETKFSYEYISTRI